MATRRINASLLIANYFIYFQALDIQKEEDLQLEKIDNLTDNVENTNIRIKANTKRMQRLL